MSTKTDDTSHRLPTTGPVSIAFREYKFIQTGDDALIYHEKRDDAWIQSSESVELEAWR